MDEKERSASPLAITLFGPFDVRLKGRPLPRLRSQKSQWLLALLALQQGRAVERAWLAGTLWPDSPGRGAAFNLRRNLTDLRQALGAEARRLETPTPRTLRLDLTGAEADLLRFEDAIARDDLLTAAALYRGPLLQGCEEEWVLQEREVREQAYLAALETLASQAMAREEPAEAVRYLRRLVVVEPLRDSAQRALMQALADAGDIAAATQVYRDLRLRLHRELNAAPDPETTALYHAIRADARRRLGASPPASTERKPAVAAEPPRLEVSASRLPRPLTRMVGRERECCEVRARLEAAPLVTLTGPGGIGKTRLAIRVAEECRGEFEDGVWFVDLSGLRDGALVPTSVATALGVREPPGRTLTASLQEFLAPHQILLVLDNCEHLVAACARLSEALLGAAPRLRILATSRQPLGLTGETTWPVPPLSYPTNDQRPTTNDSVALLVVGRSSFVDYDAVRLFVERATAVAPGFTLTERNAATLAQLCRRLDGIPLAIELAAAWLRTLTVEQVTARLDDCFRLLTASGRAAPPRHQTLRAAMDWSYDLLPEAERVLLHRLSVFAGGFTLEAAEAIHEDGEILDLLDQLVGKSLVVVEVQGREARYRLLETIRQYCQAKLSESGEIDRIRQRHRDWCLRLAVEAEPELQQPEQTRWLRRLEIEHDNLRAALEWSLKQPRALEAAGGSAGVRLAGALWRFMYMRGHMNEGRMWLERALLQSAREVTAVRAKALHGAAVLWHERDDYAAARGFEEESLAIRRQLGDRQAVGESLDQLGHIINAQGEHESAVTLFEESLALRREAQDLPGIAASLNALGYMALVRGDYERAALLCGESLSLRRKLGDEWGVAYSLEFLSQVALEQGDSERATALCHETLGLRRQLGDRRGIAAALQYLGHIAGELGDWGTARCRYEESLEISEELGNLHGIAGCLGGMADAALARGDTEQAKRFYRESLTLWRDTAHERGFLACLEALARVAGLEGEAVRAARLLGAAEGAREASRLPLQPRRCALHEGALADARVALGERAFETARSEGRSMSLEQSIAYALEGIS